MKRWGFIALITRRIRSMFRIAAAPALVLVLEAGGSIAADSSASAAVVPQDDSILTAEDLLRAEALGDAWFSRDGERVLFARQRAAVDVVDRSYDDALMTNQRLYVFERRSGRTHEIVPPANATLSYIDAESPWEPSSRGVVLMCIAEGAYRFAYWSSESGAVTVLPGRPATRTLPIAWIGGRVAYPVIADQGRQPYANRPVLQAIAGKWERAWTGAGADVTVSSVNSLFATTRPPEGSLMLSDTNGQAAKIADGDFIAVEPSPDGRYLATVRLAEPIAHPLSVIGQRGELQIFSIRGGRATLLHTYDELDAQGAPNYSTGFRAITWSPASDRLLVGGKHIAEPRETVRPIEVRLSDGAVHELPGGNLQFVDDDVFAAKALLPVGWLGEMPIAIASRHAYGPVSPQVQGLRSDYGERRGLRFDLFLLTPHGPQNLTGFSSSGTRKFIVRADGRSALAILDSALWSVYPSGSRRLSAPNAEAVLDFALDRRWPTPPLNSAYYRADVERVALLISERQAIQRVVLDLKTLQAVAVQDWEPVIASSPSLLSTATSSAEGWRRSLGVQIADRRYVLASVNDHMQRKLIAPATRFQYRSEGRDLVGWYLAPPTATARPLPAVAVVYGGDMQGERPPPATVGPPVFSGQLLAAQGYVVIYPSLPLESARTSSPMTVLANETVAAVDALAAQEIVDAARVGVMGQSFGGWSTAAILAARSDRFRAGVAMAGLYDFAWSYGTPGMLELLTDDGRFHGSTITGIEDSYVRPGPLWQDPEAYLRTSPVHHADRIDAPLLLLAGDLDIAATSLAGALRMYNALVSAGKKPALVRYWGEGHVAASPAAMRDQWHRVSTWFDHYLKH